MNKSYNNYNYNQTREYIPSLRRKEDPLFPSRTNDTLKSPSLSTIPTPSNLILQHNMRRLLPESTPTTRDNNPFPPSIQPYEAEKLITDFTQRVLGIIDVVLLSVPATVVVALLGPIATLAPRILLRCVRYVFEREDSNHGEMLYY